MELSRIIYQTMAPQPSHQQWQTFLLTPNLLGLKDNQDFIFAN